MKKILLSMIFLGFGVLASADVVSLQDAQKFANGYFSSSQVDFVWNGKDPNIKEGPESPAFYVFNGPDGWVIVAGDDCATPVIMHGEGVFDLNEIPDNMRGLLEDVSYNINEARKKNYQAPREVAQQWNATGTKASTNSNAEKVVLLQTAKWNQTSPFYNHTPTYNGKHCYTGCVATAMAIVIRYNQWPEKGKGTIPGYTKTYHEQTTTVETFDNEGYVFDYTKMPETNGSGWSNEQKEAVSQLMARCGAMVNMGYSTEGSGAYSANIAPALKKYMSYASTADEIYRSNYDNAGWFQMLKREIDYNHPIIYGGSDTGGSGGHQFVCDGYSSNNEIHINWGWGGSSEAWYAVNYLGGNTGYVFSKSDAAIVGLVPDRGTSTENDPLLIQRGITELTSGTIKPGADFKLKFNTIANWGAVAFTGKLNVALVNMDGAVKEFISSAYTADLDEGYAYPSKTFTCKINGSIAVGDRIALYYKISGDKWAPVDVVNALYGPIGVYDLPFIDVPSQVKKGYIFYPKLVFGFKRPSDIADITWTADGKSLSDGAVTFSTTGNHKLKAVLKNSDGSTDTLEKTVKVVD